MGSSMGQERLKRLLTMAIPAIAAIGIAVYAYSYFTAKDSSKLKTKENEAESAEASTGEAGAAATTENQKMDLNSASREDVITLLNTVISVQRELSKLMDRTMKELLDQGNMTLVEVYQNVKNGEPVDPLDACGLTLQSFDALLDRFAADEEVHQLVVAVIQGPESTSQISNSDLDTAKILEINNAMNDKLQEVYNDFVDKRSQIGDAYHSRTASLAAQAIVGAYVKRKFNVTSDEVERAMMVYQFDLSQRPDFMMVNQQIQATMQKFMEDSL